MKNNKIKIFFICALLIFIMGCAMWTTVGGLHHDAAAKYNVDLPWGWMRYQGKDLLITRDGILLESIEIKRLDINKKLEHTKKKFVKGMLPEDIAEVLIDDIISDPQFPGFELIENVPVTLSGQASFRLIYTFRNQEGLKYKAIKYGFAYEGWVYTLAYVSTVDYYFDKYAGDFNNLINSFKFLPAKDGKTIIPAATLTSAPRISTYAEYYRLLHNTVSKAVIKPRGSGSGTVNAAFTLLADGTLEEVIILDGSSEDAGLREAVKKAIKGSRPFPPFPDDLKGETRRTFNITIEFKYR